MNGIEVHGMHTQLYPAACTVATLHGGRRLHASSRVTIVTRSPDIPQHKLVTTTVRSLSTHGTDEWMEDRSTHRQIHRWMSYQVRTLRSVRTPQQHSPAVSFSQRGQVTLVGPHNPTYLHLPAVFPVCLQRTPTSSRRPPLSSTIRYECSRYIRIACACFVQGQRAFKWQATTTIPMLLLISYCNFSGFAKPCGRETLFALAVSVFPSEKKPNFAANRNKLRVARCVLWCEKNGRCVSSQQQQQQRKRLKVLGRSLCQSVQSCGSLFLSGERSDARRHVSQQCLQRDGVGRQQRGDHHVQRSRRHLAMTSHQPRSRSQTVRACGSFYTKTSLFLLPTQKQTKNKKTKMQR